MAKAIMSLAVGRSGWPLGLAAWQILTEERRRRDEARSLIGLSCLRTGGSAARGTSISYLVFDKTGTVTQPRSRCREVRYFGCLGGVKEAIKTAMAHGDGDMERGMKTGKGEVLEGGRPWSPERRDKSVIVKVDNVTYAVALGPDVGSGEARTYASSRPGRKVYAVCYLSSEGGEDVGSAVALWGGRVRPDSKRALEAVRRKGIKAIMASGDDVSECVRCCGEIGVRVDFEVVEWGGRVVKVKGKEKRISKKTFQR